MLLFHHGRTYRKKMVWYVGGAIQDRDEQVKIRREKNLIGREFLFP